MCDCVADAQHRFQDEIAAVTSALPAPEPGAEADEFEGRLQHALEALTMEVPPMQRTLLTTYVQTARMSAHGGAHQLPKMRAMGVATHSMARSTTVTACQVAFTVSAGVDHR